MEQKTIIEELIEGRSREQKLLRQKLNRAYKLMGSGRWAEAEAALDEVLAADPKNEDALTNKRLISRRQSLEESMDISAHRREKAVSEEKKSAPSDEWEAWRLRAPGEKTDRSVQGEQGEPEAPRTETESFWGKRLRSKRVQLAVVVAFFIVCVAATAVLGAFDGETTAEAPTDAEIVAGEATGD